VRDARDDVRQVGQQVLGEVALGRDVSILFEELVLQQRGGERALRGVLLQARGDEVVQLAAELLLLRAVAAAIVQRGRRILRGCGGVRTVRGEVDSARQRRAQARQCSRRPYPSPQLSPVRSS